MPETVSAVELAYGNWEAVVEVAKKKAAVGPLVAVSVVASVHAVSMPVVPPDRLLPPTQVLEMEKHPPVRFNPLADVEVPVLAPVRLRYVLVIPPLNVVVPVAPKVAAPERLLKVSAAVVEVASAVEVAR